MTKSTDLVWRELHWPRPFGAEVALDVLRRLASDARRSNVLFEARAFEGSIRHFVATGAHQIKEINGLIEALAPGTSLSRAEERSAPPVAARLHLARPALSLLIERPGQTSRALLAALSAARFQGEEAVLQVALGRGLSPRLPRVKVPDPNQSWLSLLAEGQRPARPEIAQTIQTKSADVGFSAQIRVAVSAASPGRRIAILDGLLAAMRTVQTPGTRIDLPKDRGHLDTVPPHGWQQFSAPEILTLIGWPLEADELPGMPSAHPKLLPLKARDIDESRVFATTNAPGEARPVGIAIEDALYHSVVLGPTGVGKSTLLLNLIAADMAAGRSVVVIDPKKDLIGDVLERIPPSRVDDVVVLDPTDAVHPVGLNPLVVPGTSPELIADGVLGIFRDLFPSAFGPRVSDVMHAAILTLAYQPDATLAWLIPLLSDARFRARLIEGSEQEDFGGFWEEYDSLSARQQAQFISPVLSRLRQFLLRPGLRRTLDQSAPRFALGDLFTKPRILLVPINSGLLGKDASRLLGSLLVSQLWQLTLARADTPQSERTPVSIYIDEAQEFLRIGGDLGDALARSRSLGVAWHVAHQFRAQMPKDMLAAIDANARNRLVFSLDHSDAKALAVNSSDLSPKDFMSLPKHAVYAQLMRGGQQLDWLSATTLPPPPITSDPLDIRARSQAQFGRLAPEEEKSSAADRPRSGAQTNDPSAAEKAPIGRKRRKE